MTRRRDPEVALEARLRTSRRELVEASRALSRSVRADLSPLASVRRNPVGSLVAGLATGVVMGMILLPRSRKPASVEERSERGPSTIGSLASGLSAATTLIPALASFILPLMRRRRAEDETSDSQRR